jgi:sulfate permease, SulP family
MSAIEALNKITERYMNGYKKVHLRHLCKNCLKLLKITEEIIEVNVLEDLTYTVILD